MKELSDTPGNPVALMGLADIAANKLPLPLASSPAEGVSEALFGIAASLGGDERNAEVSILYLNLSLYLHPDFDLGRVLLGSRYEGLERFDIANAAYAGVAPTSPYYVMTQVQMAINDGRVGNTDAGIAKMKMLSAQEPADIDVWTAYGDLFAQCRPLHGSGGRLRCGIGGAASRRQAIDRALLRPRRFAGDGQPLGRRRKGFPSGPEAQSRPRRCAEQSWLQLGAARRASRRGRRHAGKGARAAPARRLHRRQRRLGLLPAWPVTPMPPAPWKKRCSLRRARPTSTIILATPIGGSDAKSRRVSSGNMRWRSGPDPKDKAGHRAQACNSGSIRLPFRARERQTPSGMPGVGVLAPAKLNLFPACRERSARTAITTSKAWWSLPKPATG